MKNYSTFPKWLASTNRKRIAVGAVSILFAGVLFIQPAQAAFGFDDVVFWTQQIFQMKQHLTQLKDTAMSLKAAAKSLVSRDAFQVVTTQIMDSNVADSRGENAKWNQAINKFGNLSAAASAWNQATLTRSGMTYMDDHYSANNSRNLAALAEVEQMDGAAPACMAAIGQYKQNSTLNYKAIWQLMKDTFNPGINAQEQQAEIQNAMGQQQHAEQMSQGALNACSDELSLIEAEHRRNDSVESLNTWEHVAEMGGAGSVPAVPSEEGWIPE